MYNIEYYNFNSSKKKELREITKTLISNIESGNSYYQIFKKQDLQKVTKSLQEITNKIKNFSDLVVISMGGATLNPSMLVRFLGQNHNSPKIHFLNNTDPAFFADILANIDIKNTCFLAISNSGQTLETNSLVGCVLAQYKKHNITNIANRAFFITNSRNGTLKNIANAISGTIIQHQENISGRFSGLSSVSLLIAMVADINLDAYILGANNVIDDVYQNKEHSNPALSADFIYSNDKNILVNIGYLQKFDIFLEWYCQIISESLGKNNNGYIPIRGLGPNDQHSMFQLYLEGPRDKLFTFFYAKNNKSEFNVTQLNELEYLANKNLSDINEINFIATLSAIKVKNLQMRKFILDDISAQSFGAMICHFMFEIVIMSNLMKVNPFDQPGVQLIKSYSSSLISSM